ncbi:hypothetical protein SESBI_43507 [Sesbania bispinosa]|nr:hypothetical protein SESBI_43507 [Sesbania bispinosa]
MALKKTSCAATRLLLYVNEKIAVKKIGLRTVVDSGIADQLRLTELILNDAIPIKDPIALSKIHQTYRVGFLKDVVLARVLDEATSASLNSIIHGNNAFVISLLKDDSKFIQELFARLKFPTTSQETKKNLAMYIKMDTNSEYLDLMNEGIFDIVTNVLQNQDKKLVLTGTDILILFLNQDPNLLRSYVVRQEGITLLGLLPDAQLEELAQREELPRLEDERVRRGSVEGGRAVRMRGREKEVEVSDV